MTPPGGTEQTVGLNYAFRTEQAGVTTLNSWGTEVDGPAGTDQVCGFTVTPLGDTTPPTVTMTGPAAGATVSGTITVSANASDNVGVLGVQFLVDGANTGAEDTTSPYSISYNTAALANGSHTFAARARDAAGNTKVATAVTVTVSNAAATGHPRIWLDAATLTSLRQKAQTGSAQWATLRNTCNSYLAGTVQYPDGNDYPNLPNIGEGYQGSDYFEPLLNTALCYQIGFGIGDTNMAQWGAKGADILEKMSNPAHVPPYNRDDGYVIRFFGVGMAIGYDWLYNVLSAP